MFGGRASAAIRVMPQGAFARRCPACSVASRRRHHGLSPWRFTGHFSMRVIRRCSVLGAICSTFSVASCPVEFLGVRDRR